MKLKFNSRFDEDRPKGFEVEVDKIKYDPEYAGSYKVRVVGTWKRPKWLSISWFIETNVAPGFLGHKK